MIESVEGWEREQRVKENLDQSMEDLGIQRDERVQSVASDIESGVRRGEAGCRNQKKRFY